MEKADVVGAGQRMTPKEMVGGFATSGSRRPILEAREWGAVKGKDVKFSFKAAQMSSQRMPAPSFVFFLTHQHTLPSWILALW